MKKIFFGVMISAFLIACNNEKKAETTDAGTPAATSTNKDVLLDMSEGDAAKSSMMAFSKGDVDGMTANYDDNITFLWSNMDSLKGKKAVQDYYKGRWKLIDSLSFSEDIIVPIKVNNQQSQYAPSGKWVLHWFLANVKYKNGKKITFWIHNANHYNDAGKVDFIAQYIDRHPILEATKGM